MLSHPKPSSYYFLYFQYREKETIRLCLKHFRQHNYSEAFESLQKRTRVQLEDALLSKLHQCLVVEGDYVAAEQLLVKAANDGCLDHYLEQQTHKAKWVPLIVPPKCSESEHHRPGMRGGHQMCIDVHTENIYLFGGWDGTTDLSDLWCYHIPSGSWTCLSSDTTAEGGPTPRSCHKMCLDPERKKIFTIGRYLDSGMRIPKYMKLIQHLKYKIVLNDKLTQGLVKANNKMFYWFCFKVL
ncbi:Muskelin like protein [Argiope bruennichi]|uniref:Muskelin like protein n=1 Tax=Argiope bruennichi TaxID=94029 RepID=A0A8T0FRK2_ARGBR|nr:Muskelin like protein [Argiope bruennichi]